MRRKYSQPSRRSWVRLGHHPYGRLTSGCRRDRQERRASCESARVADVFSPDEPEPNPNTTDAQWGIPKQSQDTPLVRQPCSKPSKSPERLGKATTQEYGCLQAFCKLQKPP